MIKRGKKSQTTIFIVVAVLIFASIVMFIYLRTASEQSVLDRQYFLDNNLEPAVNNIQDFIIDCLEETSRDGLELIGVQGGYYKQPGRFYDLQWAFVPYYYFQGEFLKPSNAEVEAQLGLYVDDAINFCLNKIRFRSISLSYDNPSTRTSIQPDKVEFTSDLSTSIEKDGKTTLFELKKHTVTINSSLYDMLDVADYITETHREDPNFICINCLTEITREKNLFVDLIAFEEDSTLIMLLENSTSPEPYIFQFLNKYVVDEFGEAV